LPNGQSDAFTFPNSVLTRFSERAARVTTANIAHVVFLTTDVSFSKSLSKALPDRVFRTLSLGDFSPAVAKRYVLRAMELPDTAGSGLTTAEASEAHAQIVKEVQQDSSELDACIASLGGRLTDLEFLGRRIRTGENPKRAVDEIIAQSASEILKLHVLSGGKDGNGERRWTPTQAWLLIERLALRDSLRYHEVLLTDVYKVSDADAVLQALEQAELITIVSSNGRPTAIRPGKPVYQPAFRLLTQDKVLKARLDLAILSEQIKSENAGVAKYEDELKLLGKLPKQPWELSARTQWLLTKLQASQEKIEKYEAESSQLKKILTTEY